MPSSVQSFSSIFGPAVPASHSSAAGLFAEQPAPTKPQSSHVDDQSSKVNGSDQGSFRNALKRAGKNDKPEKAGSKDASKPEKAQAKPSVQKSQKTGSATQQKNGRKSANNADPAGSTRLVRPAAGKQSADDSTPESQTPDDPGSNHSHADASQAGQSAQPTPVTPPTAAPPPARAAAPKPGTATTATKSEETGADPKPELTDARATVRAVKPGPGGADDSGPKASSTDGQTDSNATQGSQEASLAANTDPGAAVAMAATAGTAVTAGSAAVSGAARNSAAASADSSGGDDSAASVAVVSASATSGMDFLSDLASLAADPPDDGVKTQAAPPKPAGNAPASNSPFSDALNAAGAKTSSTGRAAAPAPTQPTPDARFAEVNHPKIVTGVRGELLPGGGTMQLRLDPPELGDLQISVHMRDGVMTAAFQTSNDQATRLLSHSLGNLKSMLEAQGVNVEKLHVQQGPKSNTGDAKDSRDGSGRQPTPEQQQSDRREQQRKEMVQKMWDKLAGKTPVDVMA
jgi:flagellar hook-length control protein FliK